ncbi:MAG: glycine betaine ABC transporter substrate-binding protein [Pseudomonadales bacterium]
MVASASRRRAWRCTRFPAALAALCMVLLLAALGAGAALAGERPVRIGSKNFNESYLLAEMAAQLLEESGIAVERRFGLGGTLICYQALTAGEIDLYIEYTGTLSQAILDLPLDADLSALRAAVAPDGLRLLEPLGFNNTYALVVRRRQAQALQLAAIGDLAAHPELNIVVSHEFLQRDDGWPGLARLYGLPAQVSGIEHGLAYQALQDGAIDVTDAYSTDGEVKRYDLAVLADDRGYFPSYLAVPVVRADLPVAALEPLALLGGRFDDASMQALNAQVVFEQRSFAEVANAFLVDQGLVGARDLAGAEWQALRDNTLQHLKLTGVALLAAVLVGVGLSLLVFRRPGLSRSLLYASGLLQTIPSIALLALMIPLFGIGVTPAIVALFLYSLLPILRNTVTALTNLDPTLLRVAVAMGMSDAQQLRWVYLPLSLPSMLAGIRTAAVISIGTATLAAFIGAGGLGDPIVTGLALNDVGLILQGAVPAAVLAVLTELVFELVERLLLPGHLRAAGS